MIVMLHTPTLGIITIILLVGCYFILISGVRDTLDKVGYALLFGFSILGVFVRGVLPFLL